MNEITNALRRPLVVISSIDPATYSAKTSAHWRGKGLTMQLDGPVSTAELPADIDVDGVATAAAAQAILLTIASRLSLENVPTRALSVTAGRTIRVWPLAHRRSSVTWITADIDADLSDDHLTRLRTAVGAFPAVTTELMTTAEFNRRVAAAAVKAFL